MKKLFFVVFFCQLGFAQSGYQGPGSYSGPALYGTSYEGEPIFFAALPLSWVDNTVCDPPGGTYDATVILGTTNNIGPNAAGGAIGSPYALTPAGLEDAMNNWRDNADNGSQTPHFSDRWWLIEVPAESTGTVLHGSTFDANGALISIPGKVNGSTEPSACLVIDSTTPLAAGVMACGRGLPGFGGARNPGCSSPNDKASMWKVQADTPLAKVGQALVYAGEDLANPSFCPSGGCWVNHVVLRDVEVTLAPGSAQSAKGSNAPALIRVQHDPLGITPCVGCQAVDHFGLDRYYLHGWDPGDPGQPTGACSSWTNEGYVTVAPDAGNAGTSLVTWNSQYSSSVNTYFGMTFTVGSTITIGGTAYTIANTGHTQGVLTGTQNTQLSITGSETLGSPTLYTQSNPPAQYANGCGDDIQDAVQFNCDQCWRQNGYIEKVHWWASESHATTFGFDNGPYKDVNNWEEGGANTEFSGGGPVDQNGGPGSDNEIRRNYIGRDLNYRQLTGSAGNSPSPPWGCGTADGTAAHNTCPFQWSIKNSLELKLGHRNLIAGNIIENSWADSQTGFCIVTDARTCSGGAACGIYDPVTGLPRTYSDNIRYESNWVRNCPEFGSGNRSGSPGNGGGVSLPIQDVDYVNNLFSNIADQNQTGNPGHNWSWTGGQDTFPCAMSYTGSGPYTVTAACAPYQADISSNISEISSNGSNLVEIADGLRMDPYLCVSPATSADCIAAGETVVISNHAGWNGTFAMSATDNSWASDGTGGNDIYYTDSINSPGAATLCDNKGSPTCSSLLNSGDITFASLAYKITDISVGDDVYASDVGGGDTSCSDDGYAVGAMSATYAISGTVTTGLTVVYQVSTQPSASSANCTINNGAGFPKYVTLQNNTFLSPNVFDIQVAAQWWQPISNWIFNNVFADNDTGQGSDLYCVSAGHEGTRSFPCWDTNTFEFYGNVLEGRSSSNWSVAGGSAPNAFPSSVNCSGAGADPTCVGYSGFMGSSPAVTYPSGACVYDGSNPLNCPLMALPWANNFIYTDVSYVGSSSYQTQGVNTTQLNTAMTQTEYVCPAGAHCGTHGPYPD